MHACFNRTTLLLNHALECTWSNNTAPLTTNKQKSCAESGSSLRACWFSPTLQREKNQPHRQRHVIACSVQQRGGSCTDEMGLRCKKKNRMLFAAVREKTASTNQSRSQPRFIPLWTAPTGGIWSCDKPEHVARLLLRGRARHSSSCVIVLIGDVVTEMLAPIGTEVAFPGS